MVRRPVVVVLVVCLVLAGFSGPGDGKPGETTVSSAPTTDSLVADGIVSAQATATPNGTRTRTATVTRVIDGDTVEVRFASGEVDTIRLLGVDTPETFGETTPAEFGLPDTAAARDWLSEWGERASAYAQRELAGREIRVITDPAADRRGSFGRLLAYVQYTNNSTANTTDFGAALLERGLARVYEEGDASRERRYLDLESVARANGTGIWGFDGDPVPPGTAVPSPAGSSESATDADSSGSASGSDGSDSDLPPRSGGPSDPYDCSDFDSQSQAQEYFESVSGDPSGLDGDGDGVACESLPTWGGSVSAGDSQEDGGSEDSAEDIGRG